MHRARLYLVATPALCGDIGAVVTAAIRGGVEAVQLRDKSADDATYGEYARLLAAICRDAGIPFLLNDRWHLVNQVGADGVHIGQDDTPIEQVRRALGPKAILGLSTHDHAEAAVARERGADYIGLGPMFATRTKTLSLDPGGPDLVARVADATDLPLYPIGGIDASNLPRLIRAGATRAAVSSAICCAADPERAARELRQLLTA